MARIKRLTRAEYQGLTDRQYSAKRTRLVRYAESHVNATLGEDAPCKDWNRAFFARMGEMCRERGLLR